MYSLARRDCEGGRFWESCPPESLEMSRRTGKAMEAIYARSGVAGWCSINDVLGGSGGRLGTVYSLPYILGGHDGTTAVALDNLPFTDNLKTAITNSCSLAQ